MGCCIVEEATAGFEGCLGSFGLGRGDGAESDQHGVVDGPCIIKEDSYDLLNQLEVGRGEWRGIVWRAGQLGGFSVVGSDPMVGRVFCLQCDVFEALQCVAHIVGHVHVDGSVLVVPSEVDAAELFAFPVRCDGVFLSQCLEQMFGIFFADVFNSKVVHD